MTDIFPTCHLPNPVTVDYPQTGTLEPLLEAKYENHANGNKKTPGSGHNHYQYSVPSNIHSYALPVPSEGANCVKPSSVDNCPKSFYHKLPLLPRSVSTMGSGESRVSEAKITTLFDFYKDAHEESILSEGIEKLCGDLQLKPEEFKVLVLAWKLNASEMCRFTRTEFVTGLKTMKADTLKSIQNRLAEICGELQKDPDMFRDLYRFTFRFGLDVVTGQRILPADVAVLLWKLVFTHCQPPILPRWLTYLENNPHIRGIPKDTWYMFLNFGEAVGTDLSSYDDTEAWPSLFDDFVEYENDQMNQNITKSDIKKDD